MAGLDGGRINIGACSLGGARACLETASRYVVERKQFGKPIADFQATQFKLADMATELDAARLLIWRAAVSARRQVAGGDAGCGHGQALRDRCRLQASSTTRCNCMAATAT